MPRMKSILARKPRPPIVFNDDSFFIGLGYTVGQAFIMQMISLNERLRLKALDRSAVKSEWVTKMVPPRDYNQWGARSLRLPVIRQAWLDHVRDTQRNNERLVSRGQLPKPVMTYERFAEHFTRFSRRG